MAGQSSRAVLRLRVRPSHTGRPCSADPTALGIPEPDDVPANDARDDQGLGRSRTAGSGCRTFIGRVFAFRNLNTKRILHEKECQSLGRREPVAS